MTTRRWHVAVDEPWLSLLRPTVGRADYLGQLVRAYGFVGPFEAACTYTPGLGRYVDLHEFSRTGLIAQDLLRLGLTPAQVSTIPQCDSIAVFRDVPEALGWIYVMERAMLLQDGIRRHLLAHLPELSDCCAYLAAFEGRVSEHWTSFGRVLDRVGNKPETANEIISAANAGFATAQTWFAGPGKGRPCGDALDT